MSLISCVYIIGPVSGGPIKIGFTTRFVDERLCEIQNTCKMKLIVHYTLNTYEAATLERMTHQAISHLDNTVRIHGEWFNITPASAKSLIDFLFTEGLNGYLLHLSRGGAPKIYWSSVFDEKGDEKTENAWAWPARISTPQIQNPIITPRWKAEACDI